MKNQARHDTFESLSDISLASIGIFILFLVIIFLTLNKDNIEKSIEFNKLKNELKLIVDRKSNFNKKKSIEIQNYRFSREKEIEEINKRTSELKNRKKEAQLSIAGIQKIVASEINLDSSTLSIENVRDELKRLKLKRKKDAEESEEILLKLNNVKQEFNIYVEKLGSRPFMSLYGFDNDNVKLADPIWRDQDTDKILGEEDSNESWITHQQFEQILRSINAGSGFSFKWKGKGEVPSALNEILIKNSWPPIAKFEKLKIKENKSLNSFKRQPSEVNKLKEGSEGAFNYNLKSNINITAGNLKIPKLFKDFYQKFLWDKLELKYISKDSFFSRKSSSFNVLLTMVRNSKNEPYPIIIYNTFNCPINVIPLRYPKYSFEVKLRLRNQDNLDYNANELGFLNDPRIIIIPLPEKLLEKIENINFLTTVSSNVDFTRLVVFDTNEDESWIASFSSTDNENYIRLKSATNNRRGAADMPDEGDYILSFNGEIIGVMVSKNIAYKIGDIKSNYAHHSIFTGDEYNKENVAQSLREMKSIFDQTDKKFK